jgi:hypothetical protein
VRFLPSGYTAPHRVSHDLTERQREILHILAQAPKLPFRQIFARLSGSFSTAVRRLWSIVASASNRRPSSESQRLIFLFSHPFFLAIL